MNIEKTSIEAITAAFELVKKTYPNLSVLRVRAINKSFGQYGVSIEGPKASPGTRGGIMMGYHATGLFLRTIFQLTPHAVAKGWFWEFLGEYKATTFKYLYPALAYVGEGTEDGAVWEKDIKPAEWPAMAKARVNGHILAGINGNDALIVTIKDDHDNLTSSRIVKINELVKFFSQDADAFGAKYPYDVAKETVNKFVGICDAFTGVEVCAEVEMMGRIYLIQKVKFFY